MRIESSNDIVIVGGGTAGWLTAAILSAKVKDHNSNTRILLIESPNIATIGVGEGTWPTMRQTLKRIGVSEKEFLSECDASFKQGTLFKQWSKSSRETEFSNKEPVSYYHPFSLPFGYQYEDLARAWLVSDADETFGEYTSLQQSLCELGLAPKHPSNPEYEFISNYGYHLDAVKFANFLRQHCVNNLGVIHIQDEVQYVSVSAIGIEKLVLNQSDDIYADLYVDCTGMKALLIGDALEVANNFVGDQLFCDSAAAIQIPYSHEDSRISPCTVSTAHSAGWVWDIGLASRRGVGCVYSSEFLSDDKACQTLFDYLNEGDSKCHENAINAEPRMIRFQPSHRKAFWQQNCVAIGLSAGFVEPLEASALMLVEASANFIADRLPLDKHCFEPLSARFNEIMLNRWRQIIDFLKLHYVLSERDTPFWLANRDVKTWPKHLKTKLALWENYPVMPEDFDHVKEVFPIASYQYVLYGMGIKPKISLQQQSKHSIEMPAIQKLIAEKSRAFEQLSAHLPATRELLKQYCL